MNRRQWLGALPVFAAPMAVLARAGLTDVPVVPSVPLRDHENRRVVLPDVLRGRLAVFHFFFTGCSSVCPPQTALLREALRDVRSRPALRDVLFVSVSVDPLADGPQQLHAYARRFELALGVPEQWIMLTGDVPDVVRTLSAFGVSASRPNDHPSTLWLGDQPTGRWTRTSSLNAPARLVQLIEGLRA